MTKTRRAADLTWGTAPALATLTWLLASPLAAQTDQLAETSPTPVAPPDGSATLVAPPEPVPPPPPEVAVVPPPPPVAPPPPPATSFPLRPTASIFVRPEIRQGFEDLGPLPPLVATIANDLVRYRFRFGLTLEPIDLGRVTVSARMAPQAAGLGWASGGTLTDVALDLHEGVLLLNTERLAFEIGRFEMAYGEEMIIGPGGWHHIGRAFDGIRMRAKVGTGAAYVDVFATQLIENLDTNFAAGDVLFFGAYAGLGPLLKEGLDLDVYALELLTAEDPTPPATTPPAPPAPDNLPRLSTTTLGSRVRYRAESWDVRAEAGVQLQTSSAAGADLKLAYHADAEVGIRFGTRFRLSAHALFASGANGDNVAGWNQLFPTAHAFLGLSDIMGARTNVVSGVFHAWGQLAEGLTGNIDVHVFARPEGATSGYSGLETDVGLGWTIGRGLVLRGVYALFVPSDEAYATSTPAHFAELELRYTLTPPPPPPPPAAPAPAR